MYDDPDCTGLCNGMCTQRIVDPMAVDFPEMKDFFTSKMYSKCVCGKDDPCGWKNDKECDGGHAGELLGNAPLACQDILENNSDVTEIFDDTDDCTPKVDTDTTN